MVTGTSLHQLKSMHLETLIFQNMVHLKDLYVVEAVSNCPNIKYLDLQYCPEISDACVLATAAVLKENLVLLK